MKDISSSYFVKAGWNGMEDDDPIMNNFANLKSSREKNGKMFEVLVCETAPFFSGWPDRLALHWGFAADWLFSFAACPALDR